MLLSIKFGRKVQGSKQFEYVFHIWGLIILNGASLVAQRKESACDAEDTGDSGSIPGLGRAPGGGYGNPLQDSCLEKPMDRGAWGATVHGVAELDTTETTGHTHTILTEGDSLIWKWVIQLNSFFKHRGTVLCKNTVIYQCKCHTSKLWDSEVVQGAYLFICWW